MDCDILGQPYVTFVSSKYFILLIHKRFENVVFSASAVQGGQLAASWIFFFPDSYAKPIWETPFRHKKFIISPRAKCVPCFLGPQKALGFNRKQLLISYKPNGAPLVTVFNGTIESNRTLPDSESSLAQQHKNVVSGLLGGSVG